MMDNITELDLLEMTRESLIAWLCWVDANGIYTDKDSEIEGFEPLTRNEALEIALNLIKG